jgi:hypothetical protein
VPKTSFRHSVKEDDELGTLERALSHALKQGTPVTEAGPAKAKFLDPRAASLKKLEGALRQIAVALEHDDSTLQAQIIRNRLIQRVEHLIDSRYRDLHYEEFIAPWMREAARPTHLLCYLVVLKDLKRPALSHNKLVARAETAADVGLSALRPHQRRAVELLQGKRKKPNKNVIEKRAIRLAQAVEKDWFAIKSQPGRPEGKWIRKPDGKTRPQLKVEEVVAVAAPVIEEFAEANIAFGHASFRALCCIVEVYSSATARSTNRALDARQSLSQSVRQALSRYRRSVSLDKDTISRRLFCAFLCPFQ